MLISAVAAPCYDDGMNKVLAYIVFAIAACGGSKPATTMTTSAEPKMPPSATSAEPKMPPSATSAEPKMPPSATDSAIKPLLTITELAVAEGGDITMKLHANGDVESKTPHSRGGKLTEEWKTFAKLTNDGKVMHVDPSSASSRRMAPS